MCVDFRDLNKACPNDSYPLPRVDLLVDATSGHKLLSFMDSYSAFNQIQMVERDAKHTTCYADKNIYHYTVMTFGLINAGATYQRIVNKLFVEMVVDNIEAYVDDMFVKSFKGADHVKDLRKTFEHMHLHQVHLNPAKCVFSVQSGKFLGVHGQPKGNQSKPPSIHITRAIVPWRFHRLKQSL